MNDGRQCISHPNETRVLWITLLVTLIMFMYGITSYLLNDPAVILKLNFRPNSFFVTIKTVGAMDKESHVFRAFFLYVAFFKRSNFLLPLSE